MTKRSRIMNCPIRKFFNLHLLLRSSLHYSSFAAFLVQLYAFAFLYKYLLFVLMLVHLRSPIPVSYIGYPCTLQSLELCGLPGQYHYTLLPYLFTSIHSLDEVLNILMLRLRFKKYCNRFLIVHEVETVGK